ncbi:MAG: DUF6978 family protein [Anaerolineae bacterium]
MDASTRAPATTLIFFHAKQILSQLDVGKRHHNPECDDVGAPHKHKWTDRFKDKWAYEPEEMGTRGSIAEVFAAFLVECNIVLEGNFIEPPRSYQEALL